MEKENADYSAVNNEWVCVLGGPLSNLSAFLEIVEEHQLLAPLNASVPWHFLWGHLRSY